MPYLQLFLEIPDDSAMCSLFSVFGLAFPLAEPTTFNP